MKTVLVTGSAGFIGKALMDRLQAIGTLASGIDIKSPWPNADLCNLEFARSAVENSRADTVFHFAGCSDSYGDPTECVRSNVLGTMNLIDAMHRAGAKRLIFASTYLDDASPYAVSKRMAEMTIAVLAPRYGIEACVVRCCNVFGPGDFNDRRVVPSLIRKMLRNEGATVSDCKRDFVYIADIVEAYVRLGCAEQLPEMVGVSGYGVAPLTDLIAPLRVLTESKAPIETVSGGCDAVTQSTEALAELGWTPKVSLHEGLKNTVEWWKKLLE